MIEESGAFVLQRQLITIALDSSTEKDFVKIDRAHEYRRSLNSR